MGDTTLCQAGLIAGEFLPTPGNANPNRLTLTAYRAAEPASPILTNGLATGRVLPTPEQLDRFALGNTVALVDANGRPYRFPNAFHVGPGLAVRVLGFADAAASACANRTLEVVRVGSESQTHVTSVPLPSASDRDGNLLDDDWELFFFGALGNDPFVNFGGGHTLLQSYLDGSDPLLFANCPAANLGLPAVQIQSLDENHVQLRWQFPLPYANSLEFKLQTTPALGEAWFELPATVERLGGGNFRIVAPVNSNATAVFWRLAMSLN
jgi:hypothetical protein